MTKKVQKLNIYLKVMSCAILALFFVLTVASDAKAETITEKSVISLVNDDRSARGIPTLNENSELSHAAMEKAMDMVANNYFDHNSPSGLTPWYWIEKSNYNFRFAGENLAINFDDNTQQENAWMDSPSHRKNILNPKYHEIGVAVLKGKINGKLSILTVQMFGTKMNEALPMVSGVATEKNAILQTQSKTWKEKFTEWSNENRFVVSFLIAFLPLMIIMTGQKLVLNRRKAALAFKVHAIEV
jgi:hypothetical protein